MATLKELVAFVMNNRGKTVFIGMTEDQVYQEIYEKSQTGELAYHEEVGKGVTGIMVLEHNKEDKILFIRRNLNTTAQAIICMCCLFDTHFKGYGLEGLKHGYKRYKRPGRLVQLWAALSARKLKKQQSHKYNIHMNKEQQWQEDRNWYPAIQQQNKEGGASYQQSTPTTDAISGGTAAQQMSQQVVDEMPAYYQALEQQMPGYTTAAANAANQGTASTIGVDTGLYNQYAPILNNTSQQLGNSNLMANAQGLSNTLGSPQANSLIGNYSGLQNQMNPAYGSTMSGLASMMANQNPNALSGSEQAGIERGMNQSNYAAGNSNVQNPLTNIGNAMLFGQGLQQKQANFANLASSAAGTANSLNAGQNAFGLATGQPSGTGSPNTSTSSSQFLTSPNNAFGLGNTSAAVGGGIMNQIGGTFNSANSAQAGQVNSMGASAKAGCNWIITYGNGGYMPWFVRPLRDIAYDKEPLVQKGYVWTANWLIPLMHWIPLVDGLVKELMVYPLTEHCGWMCSVYGCRPRTTYQKFWFGLWKAIGKLIS